jgi:hypothetical protein
MISTFTLLSDYYISASLLLLLLPFGLVSSSSPSSPLSSLVSFRPLLVNVAFAASDMTKAGEPAEQNR